jgi:glycosyltransferase involved in cell wall biosynthesis
VALDATPLLGNPTGVGVFCRQLLSALSAHPDAEVSAYAVSWRRRGQLAERLPRGVGWRQRAMPARPLHAAWRRFGRPSVEWFVQDCDVVHGTNFVVPPTRRIGAVLTVHDLTVLRYPEMCERSTLAYPDLIRQALRRGAWIHTPSEYVAQEVVDLLGADPDRVRAVLSGAPTPQPGRAVAGGGDEGGGGAADEGGPPVALPPGTERYVLAIGTAEPRKDLPGLVHAFEAVARSRPELTLVLVGRDGWGAAALDEAIASSPVRERVVRTGWLDDRRVDRLLRGAAVLAYPSIYEGFGFPPLQAMAVGVPVVATRVGALPEVLGDAAELVPPRTPAALAGALADVLDDSQRRDRLVARGTRRTAELTWERCAEAMSALYREVAAS